MLASCPVTLKPILLQMTNYELNPEAKAFSYTREELFDCITRIIAHPHEVLTQHDKNRAMAIFIVVHDYLANHTQCQEDGRLMVKQTDRTDFKDLVMDMCGEVDAKGLLK